MFKSVGAIVLVSAAFLGAYANLARAAEPEADLPYGPSINVNDFAMRFLPAALAGRAASAARLQSGGPSSDLSLGGWNECTIAVNPTDAHNIAYASLFELRVSTDGGTTWQPGVPPRLPGTHSAQGDPSVAFDSQGRLFWCTHGSPLGAYTPTSGIDILVAECDPATGVFLADPVNVTQQAGVPGSASYLNDKGWLAIDDHPASPFADRLQLVWVTFPAGGGTVVFASHSSDHGLNWSPAVQLGTSNTYFNWPPHVTTAPNGDVYVAVHRQPTFMGGAPNGTSGFVDVHRSTDGGGTFPQQTVAFTSGNADMTFNRQSASIGSIPGTDFMLQGSLQPWVLVDPSVAGRIYVVTSDDPDDNVGSGDAANVYLARSTDFGVNWSAPVRVDHGPGTTFQIMPTAAIDPGTGAIVVHYYDNRAGQMNARGNYLLDVFAAVSLDGGMTFGPDFQVNDVPFDPNAGARCRFECGPLLFDVWTASPSSAFAVASSGQMLSYNGASWSLVPGTTATPKFGVWGSSPTNVFTCGVGGTIVRYTGVLTPQASGTTADLFGIDGRSGSDVFSVGANGTVVHYDGIGWSVLPSGTTEHLHDIWANPCGATFFVGANGKVLRYDGAWTDLSIATTEGLYAVWGVSDNDFYVLGHNGGAHHSNGSWSSMASGVGFLIGLWGTASNDMIATGWGRILRFDGATWSAEDTHESLVVRIHGSGASNVFAVGENAYIGHFDGLAWTAQPNPLLPTTPTERIGEYNGVAAAAGRSYAVWCGNTLDGASSPLDQQTIFDEFRTDHQVGISVVDLGHHADGIELETPAPNPAGDRIQIAYSLPRAAAVDLSLVDLSGRRVATLIRGDQPAGRHVVAWDRLDGPGRNLSAGIYFLRLRADHEDRVQRVAFIR